MHSIKISLLIFILLFCGCGKVLSNKKFSQVSGVELSWNQQPNITTSNVGSYPVSGRCGSDFGIVSVNVEIPSIVQQSFPCINDEFFGAVNLSAVGLPQGPTVLVATQVGIPVEAIIYPRVNSIPPIAPVIVSPLGGSTLLASAQTISGTCQRNATVRITSGIVGAPITTSCNSSGNFSLSATLTSPDGLKTLVAEQFDSDGNTSPTSSINVNLDPFRLMISAGGTAGLSAEIALLLQSGSTWSIDWGDGTTSSGHASGSAAGDLVSHTYSGPYTGPVRFENLDASDVREILIRAGGWSFDLADLPSGLTSFNDLGTRNLIQGNLGSLPSSLIFLRLMGSNIVSGDIMNLPAGLTSFRLEGRNTINGDVANLPLGLTYYRVNGDNTVTGDIANIPASLVEFRSEGDNTTFGNISTLKTGLQTYRNSGDNTVTGDIANIDSSITYFYSFGDSTISGDIANLKPTMEYFYSHSLLNTISGNISNLPVGIRNFLVEGLNTVTGDINNIPALVTTFQVRGNSTLSGDIANIKAGMLTFRVGGNATVSGDIANVPAGLERLYLEGNNTTTGDIAGLPASLEYYVNRGGNTTFGDVSNLPSNMVYYLNEGLNTTSGSINNLPATLTTFSSRGSGTATSTGTSWSSLTNGFSIFSLRDNTVRTQTEIDNILIALSSVTSWGGGANSTVNLTGTNNAAPSAVGNAAITTILGNGCASVLTN